MNDISDTYRSVASLSEGLYKESGSRFIAFARPVESEAEVKEFMDSLKKEYHDARHHCFAYRIGKDGEKFRVNDDGEPSSSAGRPILGQIDSLGLSDVLVVVVRYFGGIKLGIPGLIRAYRTATRDALDKAVIVEKVAGKDFRIEYGYESMNAVMKLIKDLALPQRELSCSEICSVLVRVRLSLEETFRERISHIEGANIEQMNNFE